MAPHHSDLNGYERRSSTDSSEERDVGHPLLKTWNPPTNHSFSKPQMKTLASICDAFSPSIDPAPGAAHSQDSSISFKDMSEFYGCSASDMRVPEDIAGLLTVLLKPKLLTAVKVVLWLLSTGLGSVILGGRASLTWQFPFCLAFPSLPRSNQETILRRWSLSAFASLRALYKLFKMITLWVVYTKIEKDGSNRNWKAIGYCGADPDITRKKQSSPIRDPLKEAVIQTPAVGANLAKALNQAGFTVLDDIRGQKFAQSGDVRVRCDVVVVGPGSGGGVAACVLAEAGYKVVIVEKGKYFSADEFSSLEGPSQMAMYEKLGSLATEDGGVNLVAGATVGGGSTINWSACLRTPPPVLREWGDVSGLELFTSARCSDWKPGIGENRQLSVFSKTVEL